MILRFYLSLICRQHLHWNFYPTMKVMQLQDLKLKNKWVLMAVSKEGTSEGITEELSEIEVVGAGKKTGRTSKRAPVSSRRKKVVEPSDDDPVNDEEAENTSGSVEEPKKIRRRTRKKKETVESSYGDSISDVEGNVTDEEAVTAPESSGKPKKTRRTRKKKETVESSFEDFMLGAEGNVTDEEGLPTSGSSEEPIEKRKRTSKKGKTYLSSSSLSTCALFIFGNFKKFESQISLCIILQLLLALVAWRKNQRRRPQGGGGRRLII